MHELCQQSLPRIFGEVWKPGSKFELDSSFRACTLVNARMSRLSANNPGPGSSEAFITPLGTPCPGKMGIPFS